MPPLILLVEDDENDVLIVQRTLGKAGVTNPVRVVRTPEDAMAYLENRNPFTDTEENPKPALIFLDVTLPGTDGFDLLKSIRSKPELNDVHVVMLTGSVDLKHVNRAYQLGANSFLMKPFEISNVESLNAVLHRHCKQAGS